MLRLAVPGVIGALFFSSLGYAEASYLRQSGADATPLQFSAFNKQTLVRILKQGLLASSQSAMTITYALVTTVLFSRFGTD